MSAEPFAHDRFLVEQLVRPMVNLYHLSGDHDRRLDRRMAIALAIGPDALQNR